MNANIEYKFEEVRDLLTEAKYLIEEIGEKGNYIGSTRPEYLKVTTELISLLSSINSTSLKDLPIEAVYKYLYQDYKNAQMEIKKLRKDVEDLMCNKEIDADKQVLVLKLLRAEREIEILNYNNKNLQERLKRNKENYRCKIKDLKARLGEVEFHDEFEEDNVVE